MPIDHVWDMPAYTKIDIRCPECANWEPADFWRPQWSADSPGATVIGIVCPCCFDLIDERRRLEWRWKQVGRPLAPLPAWLHRPVPAAWQAGAEHLPGASPPSADDRVIGDDEDEPCA